MLPEEVMILRRWSKRERVAFFPEKRYYHHVWMGILPRNGFWWSRSRGGTGAGAAELSARREIGGWFDTGRHRAEYFPCCHGIAKVSFFFPSSSKKYSLSQFLSCWSTYGGISVIYFPNPSRSQGFFFDKHPNLKFILVLLILHTIIYTWYIMFC